MGRSGKPSAVESPSAKPTIGLPLNPSTGSRLRLSDSYPGRDPERDRWILARRPPRPTVDPSRAIGAFMEKERTENGDIVPVATILLTNRECPWRCLMCDLWRNTTKKTIPAGAIPFQIRGAFAELSSARRVKLYNSGSFFDPRAVPPADHGEIARLLDRFERVIVESHPALIGESCARFRDLLAGDLEVAMGLETAHPEALAKLNKRMTVDDFLNAAERLDRFGVSLRVFVLLGVPFLTPQESSEWCRRSIEVAFDAGATAVSIIPTRAGNGALDLLAEQGEFFLPTLEALEQALTDGINLGRGRVFADLWDADRLRICEGCFEYRVERLRRTNLTQTVLPSVVCADCRPA